VYACIFGGCDSSYDSSYVVDGFLTAVAASALLRRTRHAGALVGLLRLQDHLLQAVALLVGAAVLHLRHRLLNMSEPGVCHFVLTAGDKSRTP
jgi:hypothetical protein